MLPSRVKVADELAGVSDEALIARRGRRWCGTRVGAGGGEVSVSADVAADVDDELLDGEEEQSSL